jgi:hypothetical protein
MKLVYALFGIGVVALAGFSFYHTNIKQPEDSGIKVTIDTPKQTPIYVYKEYGEMSYKNKSSDTYIQIDQKKTEIANYATVKTGNGRGYVMFPDNSSISLSSSTEIEISYEPTKVSIMQLLGSTYHRINTLVTGTKYEIRTPNTLAAIRGTKLAVTYNPKTKKTFVAVTEHTVEVTPTKNDGTPSKAPVMLSEGSLADIESTLTSQTGTTTQKQDTKMVVKGTDEVKEVDQFVKENKVIDKVYDAIPQEERKDFIEKVINTLQQQSEQAPPVPTPSSGKSARVEVLERAVKESLSSPSTDVKTQPASATTVTPKPVPTTQTTLQET